MKKQFLVSLFFLAVFLIKSDVAFAVCDPREYNFSDRKVLSQPECSDLSSCTTLCESRDGCAEGWIATGLICWPKGATTTDPKCKKGFVWGKDKTNLSNKCCITDATQCLVGSDPAACTGARAALDITGGSCAPNVIPGCVDKTSVYDKDKQVCEVWANTPWEFVATCTNGTEGIQTAIGCVPTGDLPGFVAFILKFALGAAGGIIILMLIATGYQLLTSQGNPEKLAAAKENIVSIFTGFILIVFSLVLLQTIGAGILGLPGF